MDSQARVLVDNVALGESPRFRDGKVWFCDWGAEELIVADPAGGHTVVARVPSLPFCIDWLPDGRLVVVASRLGALLTLEDDGTLAPYAELGRTGWNDIAVDGRGTVFVNHVEFVLPGGEYRPGTISSVTADGRQQQVADGVAFPNGMVVLPDDRTLVVAESYGHRLTAFTITNDGSLDGKRVWAQLDEGAAPDGLSLAPDGTIWYADVPNACCVRVAEGGEVLQRVELDRGSFACALGKGTLYVTTARWPDAMRPGGPRTGQLVAVDVG